MQFFAGCKISLPRWRLVLGDNPTVVVAEQASAHFFAYAEEQDGRLTGGKTILVLGSGDGTAELCRHYKVYSIEDDSKWLNKHHSNYIHAPLREHKEVKKHPGNLWYDPDILRVELPKIKYDLLLVDGPSRVNASRAGLIKYRDLFNLKVPILFDDVNRTGDFDIAMRLAGILRRPLTIHNTWKKKHFGVINEPS